MGDVASFAQVAKYLSHPLTLVGFVLLLFYGVHRLLISSGIIQPLSARTGSKILQLLLRYGFAIAVLTIFMGFALEFWKSATQGGITIGITLEEYENGLKEREEEIRHELESLTAEQHQERLLLQKEREILASKLSSIETAYEQHKTTLVEAVQALKELGASPGEQLQQAGRALSTGDMASAESLFLATLRDSRERAAEAAHQLGLVAESRADLQVAYEYFTEAAQLQPDKEHYQKAIDRVARALEQRIEPVADKTPPTASVKVRKLRQAPRELMKIEVVQMVKRHGFREWKINPTGDFPNEFEKRSISGDDVVVDHVTGLMWQQAGSYESMYSIGQAQDYISELNMVAYAGFADWRLPTIEELASLIEPEDQAGYPNNPLFEFREELLSADRGRDSEALWVATFYYGQLRGGFTRGAVRAVRSMR